jgi:hypothetical protein
MGVEERLRILGRAGARFQDPGDPLVREAVERLPDDARLSHAAAREVVRGMARDWTPSRLESALLSDFPDPGVLDGFRPDAGGDRVRAIPPRLLVQIGAGNVPGTGATALLRGLLVGAPTLLKPGRGDRILPELLARAVVEEAPEWAPAGAVVPWVGGAGDPLEDAALERAERVVVYGSWETVEAIRGRLSPGVPLVAYGHRISVGLLTRSVLTPDRAPTLARAAARAVSAYEQRGCVSPHALWVEEGGEVGVEAWAELLADALEEEARSVPPPAEPQVRIAMRQLRDSGELRTAAGLGNRVLGGAGEGWMVLVEPDPAPVPSCLGRTVRIHPVAEARWVPSLLAPVGRLLQSCALEAAPEEREALAGALARAGITRITTLARQPWPPAWWRHDGEGPLRALVRWVGLEGDDGGA